MGHIWYSNGVLIDPSTKKPPAGSIQYCAKCHAKDNRVKSQGIFVQASPWIGRGISNGVHKSELCQECQDYGTCKWIGIGKDKNRRYVGTFIQPSLIENGLKLMNNWKSDIEFESHAYDFQGAPSLRCQLKNTVSGKNCIDFDNNYCFNIVAYVKNQLQ